MEVPVPLRKSFFPDHSTFWAARKKIFLKTSPESEIIRILEDKGVVSTFEEPVPLVELIRDAKKQKNR